MLELAIVGLLNMQLQLSKTQTNMLPVEYNIAPHYDRKHQSIYK